MKEVTLISQGSEFRGLPPARPSRVTTLGRGLGCHLGANPGRLRAGLARRAAPDTPCLGLEQQESPDSVIARRVTTRTPHPAGETSQGLRTAAHTRRARGRGRPSPASPPHSLLRGPADSSPALSPQNPLSASGQGPNWLKNRNRSTHCHLPQRPLQPAEYSEALATQEIQLSRAESCELKGKWGRRKGRAQAGSGRDQRRGRCGGSWRKGRFRRVAAPEVYRPYPLLYWVTFLTEVLGPELAPTQPRPLFRYPGWGLTSW